MHGELFALKFAIPSPAIFLPHYYYTRACVDVFFRTDACPLPNLLEASSRGLISVRNLTEALADGAYANANSCRVGARASP